MGMFDYVTYEWFCPLCGLLNKSCQTKSAYDGINGLRKLKPSQTSNFYDFCPDCHKKGISIQMNIDITR